MACGVKPAHLGHRLQLEGGSLQPSHGATGAELHPTLDRRATPLLMESLPEPGYRDPETLCHFFNGKQRMIFPAGFRMDYELLGGGRGPILPGPLDEQ